MTMHLITFKLIEGENEYEEFEVVQNAQDYQDIELIANYFGGAEPSEFDEDTYIILDGVNCKVHCIQPVSDSEVNILRKLGVIP